MLALFAALLVAYFIHMFKGKFSPFSFLLFFLRFSFLPHLQFLLVGQSPVTSIWFCPWEVFVKFGNRGSDQMLQVYRDSGEGFSLKDLSWCSFQLQGVHKRLYLVPGLSVQDAVHKRMYLFPWVGVQYDGVHFYLFSEGVWKYVAFLAVRFRNIVRIFVRFGEGVHSVCSSLSDRGCPIGVLVLFPK